MKNMNIADRVIRTLIVFAIAAAYFTGNLSGPWALGLGVVAAVLLGTSLFSTCPAYMPFGFSTRRRPS